MGNVGGWSTTANTGSWVAGNNFTVIYRFAPPPPPPPPRPVQLGLAEALAILGLDDCASADDLRRAYRKRAREAHPDLGGSTEEMARINAAANVLRRHLPPR